MATAIDTTSDLWKHAQSRFATDSIIWLTTTSADGTPQPNPVWFIDEGTDLIIFSKPNQAKLANIARNPHISCHLQSDQYGNDVQILTGSATVAGNSTVNVETVARLMSKYASGLASLGMSPEAFAAEYSMAIRFSPTKLRGW